jgi:hypothetical protein
MSYCEDLGVELLHGLDPIQTHIVIAAGRQRFFDLECLTRAPSSSDQDRVFGPDKLSIISKVFPQVIIDLGGIRVPSVSTNLRLDLLLLV